MAAGAGAAEGDPNRFRLELLADVEPFVYKGREDPEEEKEEVDEGAM